MDIVIISQYLRNIEDFNGNNSRFVYLAKLLKNKHEIEIITSDFVHGTKIHAQKVGKLKGVCVTSIHEPGYYKNVSLRRFYSHNKLAKGINDYLKKRKKPDVCYCAVPSLDVAYVVAQYCKKNQVRFIVDVQDLWPEAFKMVFNVPIISDLIFYPMKKIADKIYAQADEIVAVSQTYADRAMQVNKKCKSSTAVFLGTELETFDSYVSSINNEKSDEILVGYVGSMSESYDLISVIDAISMLKDNIQIKLLAMGDGAKREDFIKYASQKGIKAEFTGSLPYPQMVERLITCDIAINPIRKGSAGSVINKVGDYAMASLPVVNTQECLEYRELLEKYNAGINCRCENVQDIASALIKLVSDSELRKIMAKNSRSLAEECFDRSNAYKNIVNIF